MHLDDCIVDAVERVLSWDIPDEALASAVSAEAGHLAALDTEQLGDPD